MWLNAGHIDHHHIIISARPDNTGLMTRIDGDLIPEIYPTEPLTAWLNEQAAHSAVAEGGGWLVYPAPDIDPVSGSAAGLDEGRFLPPGVLGLGELLPIGVEAVEHVMVVAGPPADKSASVNEDFMVRLVR